MFYVRFCYGKLGEKLGGLAGFKSLARALLWIKTHTNELFTSPLGKNPPHHALIENSKGGILMIYYFPIIVQKVEAEKLEKLEKDSWSIWPQK